MGLYYGYTKNFVLTNDDNTTKMTVLMNLCVGSQSMTPSKC